MEEREETEWRGEGGERRERWKGGRRLNGGEREEEEGRGGRDGGRNGRGSSNVMKVKTAAHF